MTMRDAHEFQTWGDLAYWMEEIGLVATHNHEIVGVSPLGQMATFLLVSTVARAHTDPLVHHAASMLGLMLGEEMGALGPCPDPECRDCEDIGCDEECIEMHNEHEECRHDAASRQPNNLLNLFGVHPSEN